MFVLVYLWNVQIVQLKENEKIKRIPNKIYIVLINWMDSFHMADGNSVMCISCMNPVWLLWFAGRVRKVLWANTGNIEIKSRKNTDTHTRQGAKKGSEGRKLILLRYHNVHKLFTCCQPNKTLELPEVSREFCAFSPANFVFVYCFYFSRTTKNRSCFVFQTVLNMYRTDNAYRFMNNAVVFWGRKSR